MTWPVLLLVLFGALLHASWNALVKSSSDKTLDTALIHVLCSLLALPVCLYVGPPPAESWPYIFCSLVVHVGYYFALAGAYRHGELGLTYPLMRGTAPMLVALTSFAFIGEDLTPLAWLGVACISGGVLLLGFTREWWTHRKAILFALCNAVLIAVYTVIDAKVYEAPVMCCNTSACCLSWTDGLLRFWSSCNAKGRCGLMFESVGLLPQVVHAPPLALTPLRCGP